MLNHRYHWYDVGSPNTKPTHDFFSERGIDPPKLGVYDYDIGFTTFFRAYFRWYSHQSIWRIDRNPIG